MPPSRGYLPGRASVWWDDWDGEHGRRCCVVLGTASTSSKQQLRRERRAAAWSVTHWPTDRFESPISTGLLGAEILNTQLCLGVYKESDRWLFQAKTERQFMQLTPVFSSVKWGVAHSLLGSWDSTRPSTKGSSSVWHTGSHQKAYYVLPYTLEF